MSDYGANVFVVAQEVAIKKNKTKGRWVQQLETRTVVEQLFDTTCLYMYSTVEFQFQI